MIALSVAQPSFESRSRRAWLGYSGLLAVGAVLYTACRFFPADLPFWMPWEFSWPVFLVTALSLAWYFSGVSRMSGAVRPLFCRQGTFVAGVIAVYAVLQTHVDYYA